MSEAEFADFLHQAFQRIIAYCRDGALTELAPRELPRVKGRCIGGASGDINRDIPDADDANQAVVVDHRQMADVVLVHEMTNMFERIGRCTGN
jgi:hypothetical protein